jgi:hypothetical protein
MKLFGGLLALALLLAVRGLSSLSGERTRPTIPWLLPALELLLLVGAVGGIIGGLAGSGQQARVGLLVALGGLAAVGLAVGRDYVTGLATRAGGWFEVGDTIRAGDDEGRVCALGALRVTLETRSGQRLVPYSVLYRQSLSRLSTRRKEARHSFELRWEDARTLSDVSARVRRVLLLDAGVAAGHPVTIQPVGPSAVRVTLVALSPDAAYELERRVRQDLEVKARTSHTA